MQACSQCICGFRSIVASTVCFFFLSGFPGAGASNNKATRQGSQTAQNTPQAILAACVSYAQGLAPEDRAFLTMRIARIASSHRFPQSEQWARMAFVDSSDLPDSEDKIALQKNALIALADTQPMDALRLLGTLASPMSKDGKMISEDERADSARVIFAKAYRYDPEQSLALMLEVSSYLGRTGQYPYSAWGILLPGIAKDHPGPFDEVVSTAVHFYGDEDSRTLAQDQNYFDMVQAIGPVATPSQMKLAVATGIERLQSEKPIKDMTYLSVVGSGAQRAGFDDRTKGLLYRWLPLVKEYDSADYDDLARKLNTVEPPPKSSKHAQVEILTTPDKMTPTLQQWAQDSLQEQNLINDASSGPDRAIQESAMIHSMALRSDALSKGAMTIPAKKIEQRTKLLAESKRDLDQVSTKDADYLQAVADLADAYGKSKMPQSALALVHDGLEEGTEVLDQSADAQPNTVTLALDGYNSLATLVKIGMKLDPTFTLQHVRNMRDLPLKVNLLVDIADAMATQSV